MAFDARGFAYMAFGKLNLRFGFPIETGRVFEKFTPDIANSCFGFLGQVTFSMWRKMTVHAIYLDARFIVIMGRAFPTLGRLGMDMTGGTIIVRRCFDNQSLTGKNEQ
jgi:hypothetical protein